MWRLISFLVFLIASVWVGIEIIQHPGFLLIVYQPWMVQMPLWFALLSTLLIFGLFYLLLESVDQCQFWWSSLKNWWRLRREHRSYSKTQHGLAALIEGRWKKAEKLLLDGIQQSVEPLMNYLGAARAAHELKSYDKSEAYLQKAYQVAPDAEVAIGITQAELELERDQIEQASATLNRLRDIAPRHPRVVRLLEKIYVRSADWHSLQLLLPRMRKIKLLNSEQAEQFEKNIYCELLRSAQHQSLQQVNDLWDRTPRHVKKQAAVVYEYVKQLQRFAPDTQKVSEELIRKSLKTEWHPALARLYGTLPFKQLNRQLVIVGAWIKIYGPQPTLLLVLGKLCVQIQLWGKAKDYFERCLAAGPNVAASLEYGKLLEHLGHTDEAMQQYRLALENVDGIETGPVSTVVVRDKDDSEVLLS